jgi:hypothetical protein
MLWGPRHLAQKSFYNVVLSVNKCGLREASLSSIYLVPKKQADSTDMEFLQNHHVTSHSVDRITFASTPES